MTPVFSTASLKALSSALIKFRSDFISVAGASLEGIVVIGEGFEVEMLVDIGFGLTSCLFLG